VSADHEHSLSRDEGLSKETMSGRNHGQFEVPNVINTGP
jgi:hypothetical protein